MLIFEKLLPEINSIVKEKVGLKHIKESIVKEAADILVKVEKEKISTIDVNAFPYFVAFPEEEPSNKFFLESDASDYVVAATDGSEIPIDPDFIFPYYLINIGIAAIGYGQNAFFYSDSRPKIYYKDNDLYEEVNGRKLVVRGELLEAKMLLGESIALAKVIEEFYRDNLPMLSLIDGTLIQWEIKNRSDDFKKLFVKRFENLFKKSKEKNLPIAGYVSGSHSKDVIGLIKVAALLIFKYSKEEVKKFDILEDADVFEYLLKSGERSAVFKSNVPILQFYENPVYFFYLKQREVVRIEIPGFVFENKEVLKITHKLLLSQMEKGNGYPVVLREAHEQAVVTNSDKSGLDRLFCEMFAKSGEECTENLKALSKRKRGI